MKKSIVTKFTAIIAVAALYGCGGSSSPTASVPISVPTTVSGVASTGAALSGATIELQDAKGVTKTVTADANGAYSVIVDGLTAPFLIKAIKATNIFYSFAASAGTTNVNPLTNLAVSNAFSTTTTDLGTYYNTNFKKENDTTSVRKKFETSVAQLKTELTTKGLYQNYNLSSNDDFLNGKITIGGGVDRIFDDVKINYTGSTVTMTNMKSNSTLMTMTKDTTTGTLTYTFTKENFPTVTTTVTAATCETGYVGATSTTNSVAIPSTCKQVTYCANLTNPMLGGYYVINGTKITLDMTKLMSGTTVNSTYSQQLGLDIAKACGAI